MKSAAEFYKDSTRIHDLIKEYHEVHQEITEAEDKMLLELPSSDYLFTEGMGSKLNAYLRQRSLESMPDKVNRFQELGAEIDAMRGEQQAVVAAGWAATFELTQGRVSVH